MAFKPFTKEEFRDQTYIRISQNRTHYGPYVPDSKDRNRSRFEGAALAIKAQSNMKISLAETQEEKDSKARANNPMQSVVWIPDDKSWSIEEAAFLAAIAWEEHFVDGNQVDFLNRMANHFQVKAEAYEDLGINPKNFKKGRRKADFTADQREYYNRMVGPTGFKFYTYQLGFKKAGEKKAIVTTRYKTVAKLDLDLLAKNIAKKAENGRGKYTIVINPTSNETDPGNSESQ